MGRKSLNKASRESPQKKDFRINYWQTLEKSYIILNTKLLIWALYHQKS